MQAMLSSIRPISPRLQRAELATPLRAVVNKRMQGISTDDVEALARACLQDQRAAMAVVEQFMQRGVTQDVIYLQGIAAACQVLGKWWQDDCEDFATITLATCRLQGLLYELSPLFLEHANENANGHSALFLRAPASQHSIGAFMVLEFFKRAGWSVASHPNNSDSQLRRLLQDDWFDVIGFSLCSAGCLEAAPRLISQLRRHSVNKKVRIMVGGPLVSVNPTIAADIGADFTGGDARDSQRLALMYVAAQCPKG